MLQDYLLKEPDPSEFEFTDGDFQALRAARDDKAMQAVLKLCIGKMVSIEGTVWHDKVSLTEVQVEGLVQARAAYKAVVDLILREEEEQEDE